MDIETELKTFEQLPNNTSRLMLGSLYMQMGDLLVDADNEIGSYVPYQLSLYAKMRYSFSSEDVAAAFSHVAAAWKRSDNPALKHLALTLSHQAAQLLSEDIRPTRKNQILILTGPSGAGKSTLLKHCRSRHPDWHFARSATTREMRYGESYDDYIYISAQEFAEMKQNGLFLEENGCYGTLVSELETGAPTLVDVDHKGVKAIKSFYPDSTVVCVLCPSVKELRNRLNIRGTESAEQINKRLVQGAEVIKACKEGNFCDFFIINDSKDNAIAQLESIVSTLPLRKGNKELDLTLDRLLREIRSDEGML